MLKPSEDLIQFIWKHQLLKPLPLVSASGADIEILNPGELNLDAGPDFFNGKIRVNGTILAGNIEAHVKSSDWLKHKHGGNRAYDTIILHVVYEHDLELHQNQVNHVEVLELKNLIAVKTLENYEQLCEAEVSLPCSSQLKTLDNLKWFVWLERMAVERLEEKVQRVEALFQSFDNDYARTLFALLLRNFGFNVNALPFELLAKHLPLTLLLKHGDSLLQLEALLFGMSGLLDGQFGDKYARTLQNEFEYLKTKYRLVPMDKDIFKFSKMRPANFPTLRLAQLAQLINDKPALISGFQNHRTFAELKALLQVRPGGYWEHHYLLDGNSQNRSLSFGEGSAENIIINTFAPFYFFYARKTGKQAYADHALSLLNDCRAETNSKTRLFDQKKEVIKTGADTQGIINLYNNYCKSRRCLKCGVAAALLKPV